MKNHKIFLLLFALFGFYYYLVMPNFVILRSDDFGYIESIILTLKNKRLTTSNWLEPYNAFFTLVCTLIYLITKNFYFSTWGVLSLFSLANFFLIYLILSRKLKPSTSAILTFLIGTFPLYFTKSLDFVGVIPSLTFILLSLLFYQFKKTFLFFISIFIAFSIRQNVVAMLALPIYDFVKTIIRKKKANLKLLIYLGLFLIMAVFLRKYTNVTYAQKFITNTVFSKTNQPFLSKRVFLIAAFLALSFISIFNLLLNQKSPLFFLKKNINKTRIIPLGLTLLFGLLLLKSFRPVSLHLIYTEALAPIVINIDTQWAVVILILISIWLMDYKLIKIHQYLFLITAFIFLIAIKKMLWDYYLLEVFILSLLFVAEILYKKDPNFYKKRFKFSYFAVILLFLIFIVNFRAGYQYKVMLDIDKLKVIRFETLLREDKIYLDELEGVPFGYLGWKFFNFRIGDAKAYIGQDFYHDYIKRGEIRFEILYSPWYQNFSQLNNDEQIIDSGSASIGFLDSKYRIIRIQEKTKTKIKNLENNFFPLNNKEWNDYIEQSN